MSEETSGIERRKFLCVLGAAGALAASGIGCGDPQPVGIFPGGTVAQQPVGVWKRYEAPRFIVGRDAMGFFAFSTVCPHEQQAVDFTHFPTETATGACMGTAGCTSASPTGTLTCTSGHGSTFDSNGRVTNGPALTNLPHFQVTFTGTGASATLSVNTGVTVAASARVAAPA